MEVCFYCIQLRNLTAYMCFEEKLQTVSQFSLSSKQNTNWCLMQCLVGLGFRSPSPKRPFKSENA